MATETAVLNDSGEGSGQDATAKRGDASVAELTYLDAAALATSSDPETQRLLVRQRDLTDQMDDLRRRRATMPADEYDRAFEKLGCLMAALGPEAARAAPPVREAVTECLGDVLDTIAGQMPGDDPRARRDDAIRLFASLVGAMVVARAAGDPALSDEVLEVVRAGIGRSSRI